MLAGERGHSPDDEACLAVSMRADSRLIGVLRLIRVDTDSQFNAAERQTLQSLTRQLSEAIVRVRQQKALTASERIQRIWRQVIAANEPQKLTPQYLQKQVIPQVMDAIQIDCVTVCSQYNGADEDRGVQILFHDCRIGERDHWNARIPSSSQMTSRHASVDADPRRSASRVGSALGSPEMIVVSFEVQLDEENSLAVDAIGDEFLLRREETLDSLKGLMSLVAPPLTGYARGRSRPDPYFPKMASRVDVVLVDQHETCLVALRSLLDSSRISVIGTADSIVSAAEMDERLGSAVVVCRVHQSEDWDPDGILRLVERHDGAKVAIVHESGSQEELRGALMAGASAFVSKHFSGEVLTETVARVAAGEAVIDDDLLHSLSWDAGGSHEREDVEATEKIAQLTERDQKILACIAQGLSNREIAGSLHLAEGTVRNHLVDLYRRVGVAHRAQAAHLAIRAGLVSS